MSNLGNPASDAFIARFAGHKDRLLSILRDACDDPAAFDAGDAWRRLELVAFTVSVTLPPRRPRGELLTEARQRLQPLLNHDPKDKAWKRAFARELEKIAGSFDKQPPGRPGMEPGVFSAVAMLGLVYNKTTGKRPTGPASDGGRRYYRGRFPALVREFLIATDKSKRLTADRVRQIIDLARSQGEVGAAFLPTR